MADDSGKGPVAGHGVARPVADFSNAQKTNSGKFHLRWVVQPLILDETSNKSIHLKCVVCKPCNTFVMLSPYKHAVSTPASSEQQSAEETKDSLRGCTTNILANKNANDDHYHQNMHKTVEL